MIPSSARDGPLARSRQFGDWIGYLVLFLVVIRKLPFHSGHPHFMAAVVLLGAFTLFYILSPSLFRRFDGFPLLYFLFQTGIILALGLLQPYEDTWGVLYIALGLQVAQLCSRRAALAWAIFFAASLTLTFAYTFGWLAGLGRSLFYLAAGIFVISYDILYRQTEAARQESQLLLAELQEAHRKLEGYAAQAEELATTQEHNRLAAELHDSVSQMIFSITLTAQSARILLEKDPPRLPEQLDRLQDLTGKALGQMRALISAWRPE